MTNWNDKRWFPALLLAIAITACVHLPQPASQDQVLVSQPAEQPEPVPPAVAEAADVPSQVQPVAAAPVPVIDVPATKEDVLPARAVVASSVDPHYLQQVEQLCTHIGNKLGSVSVEDCLQQGFHHGGGVSVRARPLVIKDMQPLSHGTGQLRVLLLGGIHGDEYSSISIIFKWLALFSHEGREGDFHWRIAPLTNPDGLLEGSKASRQNANGVDLNRNFPSGDWDDKASQYWQENTGSNPRRYPGDAAASEPEVQWIVQQIEQFQPDVIISVHAPYHLLDFDGPAEAPQRIGDLHLHQLGVYPGSLGNYAGLDRRIPVVTLELPSAGILPAPDDIRVMWRDLVAWLDTTGRERVASLQAADGGLAIERTP